MERRRFLVTPVTGKEIARAQVDASSGAQCVLASVLSHPLGGQWQSSHPVLQHLPQ